jgi:hypothetical protein
MTILLVEARVMANPPATLAILLAVIVVIILLAIVGATLDGRRERRIPRGRRRLRSRSKGPWD